MSAFSPCRGGINSLCGAIVPDPVFRLAWGGPEMPSRPPPVDEEPVVVGSGDGDRTPRDRTPSPSRDGCTRCLNLGIETLLSPSGQACPACLARSAHQRRGRRISGWTTVDRQGRLVAYRPSAEEMSPSRSRGTRAGSSSTQSVEAQQEWTWPVFAEALKEALEASEPQPLEGEEGPMEEWDTDASLTFEQLPQCFWGTPFSGLGTFRNLPQRWRAASRIGDLARVSLSFAPFPPESSSSSSSPTLPACCLGC